jgi:hypothetical protein
VNDFSRPRPYTPHFEIHAAPEAIRAHIAATRERYIELGEELGWLEGLYLRRVAEKAAGAWPRVSAPDGADQA